MLHSNCSRREGVIREDELEAGQTFKNTYEQSKFRAEWLVKDFSCRYGLQATIYRPSIIIGSSLTGQTTSFTGYNYLAKVFYRQKQFILRELVKNPGKLAGSGISRAASGIILPARIGLSLEEMFKVFAQENTRVKAIGMDINTAMLERANKEALPRIIQNGWVVSGFRELEFVLGDATNLLAECPNGHSTFSPNSVACITSVLGIGGVSNSLRSFQQQLQILEPEGIIDHVGHPQPDCTER